MINLHIHTPISEIRNEFKYLLDSEKFITDKSGVKTIEIIGSSFLADEESIFGKINEDYLKRELTWYKSQSLDVNDIPGGPPAIWSQVSSKDGKINSNYGHLIWSTVNYSQYVNVFKELQNNPNSRRAVMIYQRPSMWNEYNKNGMSDFICTNAVQYFIRDNKLYTVVQMRSNDVVFGYKNDRFWQKYVQENLAKDLQVDVGPMIWNAGSLHVYERHFDIIRKYFENDEKVG